MILNIDKWFVLIIMLNIYISFYYVNYVFNINKNQIKSFKSF